MRDNGRSRRRLTSPVWLRFTAQLPGEFGHALGPLQGSHRPLLAAGRTPTTPAQRYTLYCARRIITNMGVGVNRAVVLDVEVIRLCHRLTVKRKCHHEGDNRFEQQRAATADGTQPGA